MAQATRTAKMERPRRQGTARRIAPDRARALLAAFERQLEWEAWPCLPYVSRLVDLLVVASEEGGRR
jgi:hypothetical protein